MVKIKNNWIGLSAINARINIEILYHKFTQVVSSVFDHLTMANFISRFNNFFTSTLFAVARIPSFCSYVFVKQIERKFIQAFGAFFHGPLVKWHNSCFVNRNRQFDSDMGLSLTFQESLS